MRLYIFTLLLLAIFFSGCTMTKSQIACSPISLPKRPKTVTFESRKEKGKEYNNTWWIEDPVVIDPDPKGKGLMWRAPPEGAVAFSYPDLEALDYLAESWPLYADAVEKVVKDHNDRVENKESKSSWSWLWWWKDD